MADGSASTRRSAGSSRVNLSRSNAWSARSGRCTRPTRSSRRRSRDRCGTWRCSDTTPSRTWAGGSRSRVPCSTIGATASSLPRSTGAKRPGFTRSPSRRVRARRHFAGRRRAHGAHEAAASGARHAASVTSGRQRARDRIAHSKDRKAKRRIARSPDETADFHSDAAGRARPGSPSRSRPAWCRAWPDDPGRTRSRRPWCRASR